MNQRTAGLKWIALFEASKGTLALMVAVGLHQVTGATLTHLSEEIVMHLHLNPANFLGGDLIKLSDTVTPTQLTLMALGVGSYAVIRLVEAFGLWHGYTWTEWFSLFSSGVYLPFELVHMWHQISWVGVVIFMINLIIVAYMTRLIYRKHKQKSII
ncbi:DUF2127 domain-containing protein [Vibrio sp. SM6]|uniref:DUF2127 domain-containing protein n=1 Tax=Vibrio agarilyticus TaxID=2726741 RepID=A0A7X8TQD6_9VIBR|nr:DUF2127 domain-containing protein [Vibrio agarilyticus]NLS13032.1 DUF2127 domain-containing protein [Vibrio agarilyticus]